MSRPSVLAGPSDPKNPDLYYWQARAYLTAVDINYALGNILPSLLVYLGVILVLGVHFKQLCLQVLRGRDEKGCKMDVDGRQLTSTVDQVEKSRMANIDPEKVYGVDIDRQRSTLTK